MGWSKLDHWLTLEVHIGDNRCKLIHRKDLDEHSSSAGGTERWCAVAW